MGVRDVWNDWLNAGFDPNSTDPQTLRRARSVSVGVAAMMLLGPPFAIQYLRAGAVTLAGVVLVCLLVCGMSVVVLRRERRITATGHITLTTLTVVFLTVIVASGGFYDETFAAIYMLPVAAFGWLGRRGGLLWTLALMLITAAFWSLESAGWLAESQPWVAQAALAVEDGELLSLINRLTAIVGTAMLAGTLVGTHEYSEARLVNDQQALKQEVEARRLAEGQAIHEAQARARFAATLSHELRTPMTAAMTSADLLLEMRLDPNQRRLAESIVRSGQAMLGVVADVLDYSKLRAGSLALDVREFDPTPLLEDIGQMLAPQAHAKGLALVVRPDAALPAALRGDPGRLRQILINLVGNALKFTPEGQVVLSARFEGGQLRAQVRDSGIGMQPEELAHVFDPFTQAAGSGKRGGTGLGLTIARDFAHHMGGKLEASSTPGEGCCFELTVPLEEVAPARTPPSLALRGGVLVVDPHRESAEALAAMLIEHRVVCRVAHDEDDAVRALCHQDFDRVLVDCGLPTDTVERLLQLAGPDRCCLLCSPGGRGQAHAWTPEPHIAKPIARHALLEALGREGVADADREAARDLRSTGVLRLDGTAARSAASEANAPYEGDDLPEVAS